MRYADASWHRPYGARGDGAEGLGFGRDDGTVSGEITGTLVWANYPRRREDGVWTPNLRGVIYHARRQRSAPLDSRPERPAAGTQ